MPLFRSLAVAQTRRASTKSGSIASGALMHMKLLLPPPPASGAQPKLQDFNYVDKTALLAEIMSTEARFLVATSMRRSGKSLVLNQLAEMALGMREAMHDLRAELGSWLDIRIGMHSGSVIAGVIGKKKFAYDVWGDAVNTASRMESHGVPGRIHASEACHALLRQRYRFEGRGVIEVKGKGSMTTFFLEGRA
jgi:hypothetical protein